MKKNLLLALVLLPTGAFAFGLNDIQNWTGTGTNEAALVIDWADGSTTPALVWGYRWSGTATGEDMVNAITANDTRLTFDFTHYSFGDYLTKFAYTGTGTTVGSHSQNANTTSGYWNYSLGTGTTLPNWTSAANGFGSQTLANQEWDGWSWQPTYNTSTPPTTNLTAAPVPEPTTLLFTAPALLAQKRRKNK